jgi:hypothetical protein
MIRKLFTNHCHEAGETYFEHLGFTLKTSATLLFSGIALFIHGIFPFLFTTTASANIRQLNATIVARAAKETETVPALRKKAA